MTRYCPDPAGTSTIVVVAGVLLTAATPFHTAKPYLSGTAAFATWAGITKAIVTRIRASLRKATMDEYGPGPAQLARASP
ncbi:hypothetical protein Rhe02_65000 [Rhizocola hellebori]|uniref:Uncharacterized protein n=1 Tax=Rhizocola hellebori TaxID=1392758 RepID=A0A8J3QCP7_9ACTN|nr:hypothetical protein Rhe02_65000 [Rhizocola hellebori]